MAGRRFPGTGEVRVLAENPNAQAFERRVIGRYSGGRFTAEPWQPGAFSPAGRNSPHRL